MTENNDFQDMIELYKRQLLKMRQQQKPSSAPPMPFPGETLGEPIIDPLAAPIIRPNPPINSAAPMVQPDPPKTNTSAPGGETPKEPSSAPKAFIMDETPEVEGRLQIQAYTAQEALPIRGAHVTVSRKIGDEEKLYYMTETDINGFTPILEVPTLPGELSREPGNPKPYISYNIRTDYPGFFTVVNQDVPVYQGITAIQRVDMIPIPENYTGDTVITIVESGPDDL